MKTTRGFLKALALVSILFAGTPAWAARDCVRANPDNIAISGLPDFTTKFSFGAWLRLPRGGPSSPEIFSIFSKGKSGDGSDRNISFDYRPLGASEELSVHWTQPTSTFNRWGASAGNSFIVWQHVVVTVDWTTNPDTVQIYRDGTALGPTLREGSNNATPTTGATQVAKLCQFYDPAVFDGAWDGEIAEAFVLADVLTQAQVTQLAKKFSPLMLNRKLDGYWKMTGRHSPELNPYHTDRQGTLTGTSFAAHPPIFYPRGMK